MSEFGPILTGVADDSMVRHTMLSSTTPPAILLVGGVAISVAEPINALSTGPVGA